MDLLCFKLINAFSPISFRAETKAPTVVTVSVSPACFTKVPETEWVTNSIYFSQLWTLEVQGQVVSRIGSLWGCERGSVAGLSPSLRGFPGDFWHSLVCRWITPISDSVFISILQSVCICVPCIIMANYNPKSTQLTLINGITYCVINGQILSVVPTISSTVSFFSSRIIYVDL